MLFGFTQKTKRKILKCKKPSFQGDNLFLFQWISECEPQPPASECGGVDYPAIYNYLACLCQGEAPPDLNTESSLRIRQLLATVIRVLQQQSLEKVALENSQEEK